MQLEYENNLNSFLNLLTMPRPRKYFTPEEIKQAHREKALTWYHRQRQKRIDEKRKLLNQL